MNATLFFLLCVVICANAAQTPTFPPPSKSTSSPQAPTGSPVPCSGRVKLMVPLYMAPGAAWDQVAAGARLVQTVAIINPNNGPAKQLDSVYKSYMQKLHDAGVVMIGYVRTDYGNRKIGSVRADIDTYAAEYPLLSGIFLDDAAATISKLPYYQNLYKYITEMPGWTYDVLNTGIIPNSQYYNASTQIVSFEDYGTSIATASVPKWASCETKAHFAAIMHTVNANVMQTSVDAVFNKSYFGYVYLTDGLGVYDKLTSYYSSLATYVATKH